MTYLLIHLFWVLKLIQAIFLNRQPTFEDILNIVHRMYEKDGITRDEVAKIVSTFPNQGISCFGSSFFSKYMNT